jgi:hypothetical protein
MSGDMLKKVLEAMLEEEDAATANDTRKRRISSALKTISEGGEVSKIVKEMAETYIKELNLEYLFKGCGDVDANAATDLGEKYESSRKFGVTQCSSCQMLVMKFGQAVCIAATLPRLPTSVRVLILVSKKKNVKIISKNKVIEALKVLKFGLPHNGVAEKSVICPHQCGDRYYAHPPEPGYQTVTIDESLDIEDTSAWNFEYDPQDFHLDEEEDCGPAPKQQSNEDEKVQNIAGVTADVADADLQEVFQDIAKQLDLTKEEVRELLPEAIATGGTICNPSNVS